MSKHKHNQPPTPAMMAKLAEMTASNLTETAQLARDLATRCDAGALHLTDARCVDGGSPDPTPYQRGVARSYVAILRALTAYTDDTPGALGALDAAVASLRSSDNR